mgnify:CR=1 FL=1
MKKLAYIAGALMLLMPAVAGAQVLPFTSVEADAVSLGKAGTNLVETGSVANAAFSNAAVIPFYGEKFDVSAGYTLWQPSAVGSNKLNVGAAFNLKQKFGVAVGFMYGMHKPYAGANSGGGVTGEFAPKDMHVNVGLAYRMTPYLSIGTNVGYASSVLAEGHSYGAVDADFFLMAKFSDVRVTAGVANIGSKVTSASGAKYSLPTSIAVGAGYSKVFAVKHKVDVMLDADYYLQDGFAASVGAEYVFNDLASVRAGYRYGGNTVIPSYASLGAGVKFVGVKLDLAYLMSSGPMKNTLAISLGYTF